MQGSLIDAPPALPPIGGMQRAADIEGPCRWWLSRCWAPGEHVLWCMLNPSTADAEREDPTLHTIIDFSYRWGFGGLVVVNLYPFRSPSPADLRAWLPGSPRTVHEANLTVIRAKARQASLHIAAWGAGAPDPKWARAVSDEIELVGHPHKLHHIGQTQEGSPKHPLARGKHRIPRSQGAVPWTGR